MAVTQTARRITATLLSGSLADECDNVVRYDWTEYTLVIDWAPGHEQDGQTQTYAVCEAMDLDAAKAEAKLAGNYFARAKLATRVTLKHLNRTCTVETTYAPFVHEDNDGSWRATEHVVAGSRWDTHRGAARNLSMEAVNAYAALARNLHDDPNAAEHWAAEHAA